MVDLGKSRYGSILIGQDFAKEGNEIALLRVGTKLIQAERIGHRSHLVSLLASHHEFLADFDDIIR